MAVDGTAVAIGCMIARASAAICEGRSKLCPTRLHQPVELDIQAMDPADDQRYDSRSQPTRSINFLRITREKEVDPHGDPWMQNKDLLTDPEEAIGEIAGSSRGIDKIEWCSAVSSSNMDFVVSQNH